MNTKVLRVTSAKHFEDKEVHKSSHRNESLEEIEKNWCCEDKILSVVSAKTLKTKKYMKVHTEIKTQEEIENIEVVKLDRNEDKIFECNKCIKTFKKRSTWKLTQK